MPNGRKKLFSTFASSILLAASALVATPAAAQSGGGSGEYYYYNCNDPTTGSLGGYGSGYGCCQYDQGLGGWYRFYSWGIESCAPPYQSPDQPADRPSQQAADSAGQ